jgi:hypothetical protein
MDRIVRLYMFYKDISYNYINIICSKGLCALFLQLKAIATTIIILCYEDLSTVHTIHFLVHQPLWQVDLNNKARGGVVYGQYTTDKECS